MVRQGDQNQYKYWSNVRTKSFFSEAMNFSKNFYPKTNHLLWGLCFIILVSEDDKPGMLSSVKKFKLRLIPPPEDSTPGAPAAAPSLVWGVLSCCAVFDVLAVASSRVCSSACRPSPPPCKRDNQFSLVPWQDKLYWETSATCRYTLVPSL